MLGSPQLRWDTKNSPIQLRDDLICLGRTCVEFVSRKIDLILHFTCPDDNIFLSRLSTINLHVFPQIIASQLLSAVYSFKKPLTRFINVLKISVRILTSLQCDLEVFSNIGHHNMGVISLCIWHLHAIAPKSAKRLVVRPYLVKPK